MQLLPKIGSLEESGWQRSVWKERQRLTVPEATPDDFIDPIVNLSILSHRACPLVTVRSVSFPLMIYDFIRILSKRNVK